MSATTKTLSIAVMVGLASFASLAPAEAQEERRKRTERGAVEIAPMPDWSIRKEVDRLDTSMKEYSSLIRSLSRASTDLGKEFQKYLKNPHDEVLASSVEKKMALYAKTVMGDFDDIIADQDVLGSNFRELKRKLLNFSDHLGSQSKGFKLKLDGYRSKARIHERKLKEMAVRLREDPPEDADELKLLKKEFRRELRRYNLQGRYVKGYRSRLQSYGRLRKNMKSLAGLFVNLHDKFNEMIENLENERQYLHDSLRLQADTLRIKQIIRDGILGSEKAIGNVAGKLAKLYSKVDSFSQVHERINQDLHKFVESQGTLMDVTKKIEAIGTKGGSISALAEDLDKAVDLFYKKNAEPEGGKLLLEELKDKKKKAAAKKAPATAPTTAPKTNPNGGK